MDFSFTEEQQEISALAKRILDDKVTEEVLRGLSAGGGERFDRDIWEALAAANLLGIALPTDVGGGGFGIVEQCLVLEQVGRTLAPVPVVASIVMGALPVARFGTAVQCERWAVPAADGASILTAALVEPANRDASQPSTVATRDGDQWRLDGVKTCVPAATLADAILVPATLAGNGVGVFAVERGAAGVTIEPQTVTNRDVEGLVTLDGVTVDADALLGGIEGGAEVVAFIVEQATVAVCAQLLGVVSKALDDTAQYTKDRVQFERPIATFQAVGQRAADAYIDVEAVRLTLWQAAWRVEAGLDAATEVEVAKFWAAEAAHRVAHTAVHLHGGTGVDEDYPLHRYFIAAKALEFTLGGATDQLLKIGARFAASPA